MEISRDALLRVVKATRLAYRFAGDLQKALYMSEKPWTVPDEIAGELIVAMFLMSGEKQGVDDDFIDSETIQLLKSNLSDGEVTDRLITMHDGIRQPAPNTISKEALDVLHSVNGGYKYTPEGEWTEGE